MDRRSLMLGGLSTTVAGALVANIAKADGNCPPQDPSFRPFGMQTICNAYVNPKDLAISAQSQSEWCWAATIHNIFAYHGYNVPQQDIVNAGIGQVANRPGDLNAMNSVLNKKWTDANGKTFNSKCLYLQSFDAPQMINPSVPLTSLLVNDLKNNNPLLICNISHAMMLVSVNYTEASNPPALAAAVVVDPWPGMGLRTLTPQELTPAPFGQLRVLAKVWVDS